MRLKGAEPFIIVMNAGSGRNGEAEKRAEIEQAFSDSGRSYELVAVPGADIPQAAAEAAQQARARGAILVACGGDGTLSAVAGQAWRHDLPFGILPQGTFNYFGRCYGIPAEMAEAAPLLLRGRIEPVQVGMVNDILFLVNASLGLYPDVLEDREAYKQRFGRSRLVALWSGLVTLLRERGELVLTLRYGHEDEAAAAHDERPARVRTIRTPTLVVGNNALQLEQIGVDGRPLTRGELVAMAVRPVGTLEMYWLLLRGALSRLGEAEEVSHFGFRQMEVAMRGRRRVKVAMDGEIHHLPTPLSFAVAPRPLRLVVGADRGDPGAAGRAA
ncbi:diacylglycerol/lipid kinase family protein [Verticiella sediminum]|nr:diacylglycerol kinase family protein [Verticiella sediminum]